MGLVFNPETKRYHVVEAIFDGKKAKDPIVHPETSLGHALNFLRHNGAKKWLIKKR